MPGNVRSARFGGSLDTKIRTAMIEQVMPGLRELIDRAALDLAQQVYGDDPNVFDQDEMAHHLLFELDTYLGGGEPEPEDVVTRCQLDDAHARAWFGL